MLRAIPSISDTETKLAQIGLTLHANKFVADQAGHTLGYIVFNQDRYDHIKWYWNPGEGSAKPLNMADYYLFAWYIMMQGLPVPTPDDFFILGEHAAKLAAQTLKARKEWRDSAPKRNGKSRKPVIKPAVRTYMNTVYDECLSAILTACLKLFYQPGASDGNGQTENS